MQRRRSDEEANGSIAAETAELKACAAALNEKLQGERHMGMTMGREGHTIASSSCTAVCLPACQTFRMDKL